MALKMDIKHENVCGLCFDPTEDTYEVIDDITREMLDVLLLKMDFDVSEESMICETCADTLKKSFFFKSVCTETEELVISVAASKEVGKFELKHIYEDKKFVENPMHENFSICRFCVSRFEESNVIPIDALLKEEMFRNMLPAYLPEMDLKVTKDPVVCTSCRRNLERYFKFIQKCLGIKDEICMYRQVEGITDLAQTNLGDGVQFVLKSDLESKQETSQEYSDVKVLALMHTDVPEVRMYNCTMCTFKTKRRYRLTKHMLVHKDVPEEKVYKCTLCLYGTIRKELLKSHMLVHKDPSEVQMYNCDECTYATKHKKHLKSHALVHKDISEIKMYSCSSCTFKTKRKLNLNRHIMLIHKDISEIRVYNCALCTFGTKTKQNLKRHMSVHESNGKDMLVDKNASETVMHNCTLCTYKTRVKYNLKTHMLTHKSLSEVETYDCTLCTFKSKYKRALDHHMLMHKDTSEVQMYNCALCTFGTRYRACFVQHTRVHRDNTEVETYNCALCKFKTRRKYRLRDHLLIHKSAGKVKTYKFRSDTK